MDAVGAQESAILNADQRRRHFFWLLCVGEVNVRVVVTKDFGVVVTDQGAALRSPLAESVAVTKAFAAN